MDSTNHNAWTLTKHVAVSINKAAGKLDVHIYGDKSVTNTNIIVPPIDIPPTNHDGLFQEILLVVVLLIAVGIGVRKWVKHRYA